MYYRADLRAVFSFYVGVPPFVGQFIPVPGVDNLRFRYTVDRTQPYKTILLFDGDDRLRVAVSADLPESER